KGKDYKFEGGKMVFVGLSPDQQKKVNIKLTNGTEFKDFAIDPTKATNAGCFNFDANGALNKVDQGASKCEDALKQHQDAHKNSRLEFQTGLAYTKDQFKGLGFKPYGSQDTFALPQVAYAGIEGGGKFEADVRVLNGGPQGNEDLSKRTWVALWIKDGKFLVAKFNIKKSKADTLQKAPNPEPGKPFDPTKLPPRQTIAVGDIENLATKSYDTEAAAKTGENLKEPPKPGDQPNMPPPPQS
ncbi:MAG: hypothetical protein FJZ01_23270, partial [Candidatus Sericytochromatia bacterium]|nr:hypothetical protein [Candidatus Tanganyikabacteria bacterium]